MSEHIGEKREAEHTDDEEEPVMKKAKTMECVCECEGECECGDDCACTNENESEECTQKLDEEENDEEPVPEKAEEQEEDPEVIVETHTKPMNNSSSTRYIRSDENWRECAQKVGTDENECHTFVYKTTKEDSFPAFSSSYSADKMFMPPMLPLAYPHAQKDELYSGSGSTFKHQRDNFTVILQKGSGFYEYITRLNDCQNFSNYLHDKWPSEYRGFKEEHDNDPRKAYEAKIRENPDYVKELCNQIIGKGDTLKFKLNYGMGDDKDEIKTNFYRIVQGNNGEYIKRKSDYDEYLKFTKWEFERYRTTVTPTYTDKNVYTSKKKAIKATTSFSVPTVTYMSILREDEEPMPEMM